METINSTRKRILSLLLCGIMLFLVAPLGTALAANDAYTEINGDGTYSYTGSVKPIVVESGTPTIVLRNATITAANAPAIWIKPGATVKLSLEGDNALKGGEGYAGICVEPDYPGDAYSADASAKLIVSGSGSLKAEGGDGDKTDGNFGGGAGIGGNGQNFDGYHGGVDFGKIEFSEAFSGTIYAYGGMAYNVDTYPDEWSFGAGAGIGSGGFDCQYYNWGNVCGWIDIKNGTIITNDGKETAVVGAGIGSGTGGLWLAEAAVCSEIVINIAGGNIIAHGGSVSAGIGGGSMCDGGVISISGGVIEAKAGAADGAEGASGIGGGGTAAVAKVSITGGAVTATASGGAAGIGGGSNTSGSSLYIGANPIGIINISGENTRVTAYGGTGNGALGTYGGAGIGAGYPTSNNDRSVAFDISITNGATVDAYGGYHAQAIGYGYRPGDINAPYYIGHGIKLALDDTISLWAQNDDCFQPALVATTKYDADPIKYKSDKKYLVAYTDENKDSSGAESGKATGYLEWKTEQTAKSVEWAYADGKLSIADDEIRKADGLSGNWAVLYPIPEPTVPEPTVPKPTVPGHDNTPAPEETLDKVPQTGDTSNVSLWAAFACLSLFGMLAAAFGRKRFCKRRE